MAGELILEAKGPPEEHCVLLKRRTRDKQTLLPLTVPVQRKEPSCCRRLTGL